LVLSGKCVKRIKEVKRSLSDRFKMQDWSNPRIRDWSWTKSQNGTILSECQATVIFGAVILAVAKYSAYVTIHRKVKTKVKSKWHVALLAWDYSIWRHIHPDQMGLPSL
jgi:hypothetical protein